MNKENKFLAVIPARGGSKCVPGKNIKPLGGKPLICYTLEAAREVFSNHQICVSTDDIKIKEIVEQNGLSVPFIRPPEISTDTSGTHEVLLHALEFYENKGEFFDGIVLLQPTSPFRTAIHIREAIKLFTTDIEMVVSVRHSKSASILFKENKEGYLERLIKTNLTNRQDFNQFYEYNGAIYVINIISLKSKGLHNLDKVIKYIMPDNYSLDIDTELDFSFAQFLLSNLYTNDLFSG